MIDYFKKIAITKRSDDALLYEFVMDELETGTVSKGLWGKALADSDGDDGKAQSIYMKYRVQSIKDVFTAKQIAYNELTKPNLLEYIQEIILPTTTDYISLTGKSISNESANYHVSGDEESIYDEVAAELANDIRKEGLWLKSIENANGDETKAKALYIKYRSKSIMDEREAKRQALEEEEIKKQELEAKKQALIEQEIKKQALEAKKRKNVKDIETAAIILTVFAVTVIVLAALGVIK